MLLKQCVHVKSFLSKNPRIRPRIIREFQRRRRQRQRERQKKAIIGLLSKQLTSRFFVHFFAVTTRLRRENA